MSLTKYLLATFSLIISAVSVADEPVYYAASMDTPYSKAVKVDNTLYLSGLLGTGKDGLPEDFSAQITQLMDNLTATLKEFDLTTENVFKCTVMIDHMASWPEFNAIYVKYFKPGRLPVRSAFGSDGLPMGAAAELECMAYLGDDASSAR